MKSKTYSLSSKVSAVKYFSTLDVKQLWDQKAVFSSFWVLVFLNIFFCVLNEFDMRNKCIYLNLSEV